MPTMTNDKIFKLEVFSLYDFKMHKYADIKVRYGEIIWLKPKNESDEFKEIINPNKYDFLCDFTIKDISQNFKDKFDNKITHYLPLPYPYDKSDTFVFLTDKQLLELGLKKHKRFSVVLNETQRWFIGICVALFIGVGNWYFDFLPTREKRLDDKHIGKTKPQEESKMFAQDSLLERKKLDSLNILKNDSLHIDLND